MRRRTMDELNTDLVKLTDLKRVVDNEYKRIDSREALRRILLGEGATRLIKHGNDYRLVDFFLSKEGDDGYHVLKGRLDGSTDYTKHSQRLHDILEAEWLVSKHSKTSSTNRKLEHGEGEYFIRIPNEYGVLVKAYLGSTIHIPSFDSGKRGSQFVKVIDILDADTISAYVSGKGEAYKIEKMILTRSKLGNGWRWDKDPEKEGVFTLGIDYVKLKGAKLYRGMEVKITEDMTLPFVNKTDYQINDQWLEIMDFVDEEEIFVNISLVSKLTGDTHSEGVPIHVSYLGEFRGKEEEKR